MQKVKLGIKKTLSCSCLSCTLELLLPVLNFPLLKNFFHYSLSSLLEKWAMNLRIGYATVKIEVSC